jgi:hypothetical protein
VSTKADVHGQLLLSVVKTCYNIHLMSASPLILVTAKATLDQMLGAIFQRFEREGSILRKEARNKEASAHQGEEETESKSNGTDAEESSKGKDKAEDTVVDDDDGDKVAIPTLSDSSLTERQADWALLFPQAGLQQRLGGHYRNGGQRTPGKEGQGAQVRWLRGASTATDCSLIHSSPSLLFFQGGAHQPRVRAGVQ